MRNQPANLISPGHRGRTQGHNRSTTLLTLALLVVTALLPPALYLHHALAGSTIYSRTTRSFQGKDLRTRGYLDDLCLQNRFIPCLTFTTKRYRPEGTAQAVAIQELAKLKDSSFAPLTDASSDPVQWEVAGRTDPDPAADVDDAGSDTPCPPSWRIDIVTDDTSSTEFLNAYEVKAWNGGNVTDWVAARRQLNCYISQATSLGLTIQAGEDLVSADSRWAQSYVDNQGQVWCTWADQYNPSILDQNGFNPSGAGLIFFARQNDATIPPDVRSLVGCNQVTEDHLLTRCRIEIDPNCLITAGAALVALSLLFVAIRGEDSPVPEPVAPGKSLLRPAATLVDQYGIAYFTVRVAQVPTPLSLLLDYGDGTHDTFTIPADPSGQSLYLVDSSHAYAQGFGITLARAQLFGAGAIPDSESDSVVAEDSDLILPGFIGFPDQSHCFGPNTISAGANSSLAVDSTGGVWAWGDAATNIDGTNWAGSPTLVPGLHHIVAVAAGYQAWLAQRSDGSVWMWGSFTSSASGTGIDYGGPYGSFSYSPALVEVAPIEGNAQSSIAGIAATGDDGYAVTAGGGLWAWGDNTRGGLGDGTTNPMSDAESPGSRPTLPPVAAVAGHSMTSHVVAVDGGGQVYGWGYNEHPGNWGYGMVQVGLPAIVKTPQQISGDAAGIGAGEWMSATVTPDHSAWVWPNTTTRIYHDPDQDGSPEQIPGLPQSVASVTGTNGTGTALMTDGSVFSWGDGYDGEFGDGGQDHSDYYGKTVFQADVGGVTQLSAGQLHVLARLSDGSLAAWGGNWSGQIGNGQVVYGQDVLSPFMVPLFGPTGLAVVPAAGTCGSGGGAAVAGASLAQTSRSVPRADGGLEIQPHWRSLISRMSPSVHPLRRATHAHRRVPMANAAGHVVRQTPVASPFRTHDIIVSR